MLIMTRRFSDIPLDSTLKSQRMLIEDSLSHSTWLMTPSPSSSQHRRTLVSLKDHSLREGSTRTLIRTTSSSPHQNYQSVVTSRSTDTTSTSSAAMNTLLNTSPLTPSSEKDDEYIFEYSNHVKIANLPMKRPCFKINTHSFNFSNLKFLFTQITNINYNYIFHI